MSAAGVPLPWLQGPWSLLQQSRQDNRVPHALLFAGPAGVGKQALAMAFSKALLCRQKGESACGDCDACVQFESGTHPDFRHLLPDEKTGNFKIEAIRTLGQELALTSQYGGYRIAILEGVEGFTEGAANALLKTLEEPPSGVLLLLLTPWPGRLMATIRSRCQQLRCAAPSADEVGPWLLERGVADPAAALAQVGGGPLLAVEHAQASGLSSAIAELLPQLATGSIGPAAAAKSLADYHNRDVAAAMLASVESAALQQCDDLARGVDIACLGARRPAQTVFALRDRIVEEHRLDPTGLSQQAALERLMMLVVRGR